MKSIKMFYCIVVLVSILASSGRAAKLSFHLDFEHGAWATTGRGKLEGRWRDNSSQLSLAQGLHGQGLLTGGHRQALEFPAKGIMNQQGTVTFWMRMQPGQYWKNMRDRFSMFFGWEGKGMKIFLYKFHLYERPFLMYWESAKNSPVCYFPVKAPADETQWHQYAFTWRDKVLGLYIDGQFIGNILLNKPLPAQGNQGFFYVGQGWGKGNSNSCIMDDISIYDQPLTQFELFQSYLKESDLLMPQRITLRQTQIPQQVDGVRAVDEWKDAAVIPLMIHKTKRTVVNTPSLLWLSYDQEALRFFLHSPLDEKFFENAHTQLLHGYYLRERTEHDTDIVNDDSFELSFRRHDSEDLHLMSANTLDVKYEYFYTDAGFPIVLDWNPEWQVKSSFDSGAWNLEGRIPWKGLKGRPRTGDIWEMNFNRIWKKLKQQDDMWTIGAIPRKLPAGAQVPSFSAGQVCFGGNRGTLVSMESIRRFNDSEIDVTLKLDCLEVTKQDFRVRLSSSLRTLWEKTVSVSLGKPQRINVKRDFVPREQLVRLEVLEAISGKQLYCEQVPVCSEGSFEVELHPFPSLKKVNVRGDFAHLHLDGEQSQVRVSLLDSQGNSLETRVEKTPASFFNMRFDVAGLSENQDYLFRVECLSGSHVIQTVDRVYRHQPLPAWFHNNLGISDQVPDPWTPMTWKDNVMECWGRQLDLGQGVLPVQLVSQHQKLLAGPVRLLIRQGSRIVDVNEFPAQMLGPVNAKVNEIETSRYVQVGKVRIEVHQKTEFDGFMWFDMRFRGVEGGEDIDGVRLEIPMSEPVAQLMIPHDYSLKHTGKIHPWQGTNRPLWVGNGEVGVQFVAEHAHNWKNQDRNRQLRLVKENGLWRLIAEFADQRMEMDKPVTYSFGLHPTPVKRVHPDHRKWRIDNWVLFSEKHTAEKNIEVLIPYVVYWSKVNNFIGEVSYPIPRENLSRKEFNRIYQGIQTWGFPYYQLHAMWYPSPEFKQFGYEWLTTDTLNPPLAPKLSDQRVMNVCQGSRSFQDFVLYGLDQLQRQANPRGYYFDCSQPRSCSNLEHGCGVEMDGLRLPTLGIRATRRLLKRIYIHLKSHRPDGLIMFHNSGQVVMPAQGFADLLMDGENFNGILFRNRGYEERLKPDTYLAEYVGRNLGAVVALLPEFQFPGKLRRAVASGQALTPDQQSYYDELSKHSDYLFGLSLLHDSQIWWSALSIRSSRKHYDILKRMDYASGKHEFIPYWKPGKAIAKRIKNADYVSFYKRQGEVVVVAMNYGPKKADISVELNRSALGLGQTGELLATMISTGYEVSLDKTRLTIKDLPPYGCSAILIRTQMKGHHHDSH